MSLGTEVKHCKKCDKLIVREETEMQWVCNNCNFRKYNLKIFDNLFNGNYQIEILLIFL